MLVLIKLSFSLLQMFENFQQTCCFIMIIVFVGQTQQSLIRKKFFGFNQNYVLSALTPVCARVCTQTHTDCFFSRHRTLHMQISSKGAIFIMRLAN